AVRNCAAVGRAAGDGEDACPTGPRAPAQSARRGAAVEAMNQEEIRDLAAMYALGGLDGDDRLRFEALLRSGDLDAAAALREFESSLVSLATESAEAPPPSVKTTLMSRIADETG